MVTRAVVIGVGNRWRRDDAAGLLVLDALSDRLGVDVALIESDGEPTRLIDAFAEGELAVMVDAVKTGAEPGAVHRFTSDELPPGMGIGQSSHLVGLIGTIELGRLLGKLPNGLVLIGIEATDFYHGEGVSDAVAAGVTVAVETVLAELED
jgi:hydrogenase maturation protease